VAVTTSGASRINVFFAYQPLLGDGDFVAHLADFKSADPRAKAVLMIRETISRNSPWAGVVVLPDSNVGFQSRLVADRSAVGDLKSSAAKWIRLVRQRNSFLIRTHAGSLEPGQMVDVLGRVEWGKTGLVLNPSRTRIMPETADGGSNGSPPIPTTGDIRDLPISELVSEAGIVSKVAHAVRVRIRGVATFNDRVAGERFCFVQDQSGGARFYWRGGVPDNSFQTGDWIELTGSPVLSGAAPEILANGIARLGSGELPESARFFQNEPGGSTRDGQWTELEGVVRFVTSDGGLRVMTRTGGLTVRVGESQPTHFTNLVNALVRVRGVVWSTPELTLLLPSESYLDIVEAPPQDPFGIPTFSIASLQTMDQKTGAGRRLKVSGVVTCQRNDFLMLKDESGGIRVETAAAPGAKIGDAVAAVGFPSSRRFGMVLTEALLCPEGQGQAPNPVELTFDNIENPTNNGELVAVEAVLLEQHPGGSVQTLDVQAGQRVFRASLPNAAGPLPHIIPGSRIRLTGVMVTDGVDLLRDAPAATEPVVGLLELLLRHPQDVRVIERPPWWNWKYSVAASGMVFLVFAGALLWIRTLRRRVEARTSELRQTMARLQKVTRVSATLAERDRLAGEIHDSLEQSLSAIMMQMEAAVKLVGQPEALTRYLIMAKNMAGFSRTEVQHAVWDLQSPLLENADLATALRRVAQDVSAGDPPRVTVEISGAVFKMASVVEHHLLRIAQEAITNAVKHGNPKTIALMLEYHAGVVKLTVRDDGVGFVPEAVPIDGGHFGLQGMRVRARKINAELNLSSQPGGGTCLRIVVPRDEGASPETAENTTEN
jgi:signal transduction histidine kinase